jgi:chaperonin cofactor prefoldin
MELSERALQQVGGYVKEHLGEWMREVGAPHHLPSDPVLLERVVRIESELRSGHQIMEKGFAMMEKRFEQVEKRFEQVDKRFEQIDKRFEQVDKRFEELRTDMNTRFEVQDKRFEVQDKRFEELRADMNARFEENSRARNWWLGISTLLITLVVAASTAITLVLGQAG